MNEKAYVIIFKNSREEWVSLNTVDRVLFNSEDEAQDHCYQRDPDDYYIMELPGGKKIPLRSRSVRLTIKQRLERLEKKLGVTE